jgi:hypothetical protein
MSYPLVSLRYRLESAIRLERCFWKVQMRFYTALIALLLIVGLGLKAEDAVRLDLAEEGKTQYSILVARSASPAEKHAAEDLSSYLKQVTGAEFQRVEKRVDHKPVIAVGYGAAAVVDMKILPMEFKREEIFIGNSGKDIILTGDLGDPRGTLYAVYTFLEDFVGVQWWTPEATEIPKQPTLSIKLNEVRYAPPLEYRDPFIKSAFDPDFAVRNRINGLYREFGDARGGAMSYANSFVHTFYDLVPPKEHFATHPEWFAEVNGKRVGDRAQLCLSNPELLAFTKERVRQWLNDYPKASIISVSQNDFMARCECKQCKAIEDEEGSACGPLLRFVNAIADDIRDYPGVSVDTLAYQYSRKAPKITKPRDNVIIRLCSIECSFLQPLDSPANKSFREDIESWSKIAKKLYVWDYVINFSHYLAPHPNLRVLQPNIQFFVEHGVRGILEQGNNRAHCGEFEEMKAWVLAKLLWNPQLKADALIDQFLNGYYGKAAPSIRAYIDLLHNTAEPTGYYLKIDDELGAPYLTLDFLSKAEELMQAAVDAVADDATLKRRAECVQLGPRYAIAVLWPALKREAASRGVPWPFKLTRDELIAEIRRVCLENKIEAMFEDWSGDTTPHIDAFANRFGGRKEPARPEGFEKVEDHDFIDLQDESATLWGRPEKSNWVVDERASDGKAAWMPGNYYAWNFYLPLSASVVNAAGEGEWTVYAAVRGKKTGDEGNAFSVGVYDNGKKRDVSKVTVPCREMTDDYHIYKLGDIKPTATMYFWASPQNNPKVEAVYVDRFFMVRRGAR